MQSLLCVILLIDEFSNHAEYCRIIIALHNFQTLKKDIPFCIWIYSQYSQFFLILCLTHAMFVLHIWSINFSIYILDKIIIIIFNNTFIHCTFITTTNHFFNYCLVTLMIANERSNIHIQFAYYLKIWKLSFSNDFPIHHKFLFKQEMKDISI